MANDFFIGITANTVKLAAVRNQIEGDQNAPGMQDGIIGNNELRAVLNKEEQRVTGP